MTRMNTSRLGIEANYVVVYKKVDEEWLQNPGTFIPPTTIDLLVPLLPIIKSFPSRYETSSQ